MKETLYLIGQISPAALESFTWRENVRKYFEHRADFEVIDPCLDEFNTKLVENKVTERIEIYKEKGIKLIVPRDRWYVLRSTIGVCNLNHYDKTKPIIGTMFELAWYCEVPEKAVIGIYDGNIKKDIICSHPFVDRAVDTWVKNEQEACELIEYYFKKK